ncbi:tRNA lysidine(34) synthetase TilS [Paucilactobacillus wasatchensis]|uniref:tRNA(Ile)-lysidine synthase n=1 Tax=Paucilactobacillus wasatchensis TaxID=1335616 RepID=A0A0D1A8P3_9LACO|nr:tRNA lysidine(34) synthetase TilS [Paucilactobacillus wasatchensis]KIS04190.1 tRNA(Ile)-lysidine synthetase [Paucilactobacillus wasatchensis]
MGKLTLQAKFERNLAQYRFFNSQETVVLAVSTGIDSMTLLELFLRLPQNKRPQIVIAHVNHELRAQSVQEEEYLRLFCRRHQLKLVVKHWPLSDHPNSGVEVAARDFRYQFFAELMKQTHAKILVTAHQANDQAETILMKLTRGGQLSQLAGIANQRKFGDNYLIRPLINIPRSQIKQFAEHEQVKWFEDVTNADLTIQRNRYRHQIVPSLQKENVAVIAHITDYQQQLTDLLKFAHTQVERIIEQVSAEHQLNVDLYLKLTQTSQKIVLRQWLENDHDVTDISQAQLAEIYQLINNSAKPQGMIRLNQELALIKEYHFAWVEKISKVDKSTANSSQTVLELDHWQTISQGESIGIITPKNVPNEPNVEVTDMWLPKAAFPLQLRFWQPQDSLLLKNGRHQLVRRILIDQKLSNAERQQQMVVTNCDDQVIWVVGRKFGWFARPTDYQEIWQHVAFVRRFGRGE